MDREIEQMMQDRARLLADGPYRPAGEWDVPFDLGVFADMLDRVAERHESVAVAVRNLGFDDAALQNAVAAIRDAANHTRTAHRDVSLAMFGDDSGSES